MKNKKNKYLLLTIISLIVVCVCILIYFIFNNDTKTKQVKRTTTIYKETKTNNGNNSTTITTSKKVDATTTNKSTKKKEKTTTNKKNESKTTSKINNNKTTTTKVTKKDITTNIKTTNKITTVNTTTKTSDPNKIVRDNVIDVKEGSEVIKSETKYGVKITITEYYDILTYVDGSTEKIVKKIDRDINRDSYNGNTSSFKSEASSLISKNTSYANTILDLTNKYRIEAGVTNNLSLDNTLSLAANIRALELAYSDVFSHTRPNGTYFNTVLDEIGYSYMGLGENIAYGQKSASIVSEGWKNSSGHYKNMINEKFNKLGVGHVNFEGINYWVQIFSN